MSERSNDQTAESESPDLRPVWQAPLWNTPSKEPVREPSLTTNVWHMKLPSAAKTPKGIFNYLAGAKHIR